MTRGAGLAMMLVLAACGGGSTGEADAAVADAAAIADGPPVIDGAPLADGNCVADPTPPGGACPPACTGGCMDGVCTIACGPAGCGDQTITCPADFACTVTCLGVDACDTTIINCPAQYACTVSCDQYDACGDVTLMCGAASCSIACLGGGGEACGGSMVQCGTGGCQATCAGVDHPVVTCGNSCGCQPCP